MLDRTEPNELPDVKNGSISLESSGISGLTPIEFTVNLFYFDWCEVLEAYTVRIHILLVDNL